MRGLGLAARYGAYLHALPGITLATVNLVSLFGLHLAIGPGLGRAALRRRRGGAGGLVSAAALAVAAAEVGRRRGAGTTVFPPRASLLAPLWLVERGVGAWLAVGQRRRFGGVRYGDSIIPVAAHSRRALRRRIPRQ